eukprot:s1965_g12.t1
MAVACVAGRSCCGDRWLWPAWLVACVAGRSCCGDRWLWPAWLVAVRVALERLAEGSVAGQMAGSNPFKNRWLWLVAAAAESTDGCGLRLREGL